MWLRTAFAILIMRYVCGVAQAQALGTWSTAQLSVGRWDLAATSVGNVAIFAGGRDGNASFMFFLSLARGVAACDSVLCMRTVCLVVARVCAVSLTTKR